MLGEVIDVTFINISYELSIISFVFIFRGIVRTLNDRLIWTSYFYPIFLSNLRKTAKISLHLNIDNYQFYILKDDGFAAAMTSLI